MRFPISSHIRRTLRTAAAALLLTAPVLTTASATNPSFPLSSSKDGRYLVDTEGTPFFLHGDTAWSLIVELDDAGVDRYLADRKAKGFSAILVNLIEHKFARHPPANRNGDQPFITPGDFTTPNPVYFDHADAVLKKAEDAGIAVLLCPAYLGYKGGDEGFFQEQFAAGEAAVKAYGEFVAQRFAERKNIIWAAGGDFTPPPAKRWVVTALIEGIRAHDPHRLMTYHGRRDERPRDDFPAENWLTLSHVYTRANDLHRRCHNEFQRAPAIPFILIESAYENEHDTPRHRIRAQAYAALTSGAGGHVFGNNPIWHFGSAPDWHEGGSAWQANLSSPGSNDMATLGKIFRSLQWWKLAPDTGRTFLVADSAPPASQQSATAALATDGAFALAYIPHRKPANGGQLSFDLSRLTAPVDAQWIDPGSGARHPVNGSPFAGTVTTITPPARPGSTGDWLLLFQGAAGEQ